MAGSLRSIRATPRFWFLALVSMTAVAALAFIAASLVPAQDAVKVDLRGKSVAPAMQEMHSLTYGQPGDSSLRVAIAGVLSPASTLEAYQKLLNYMAGKIGRPVTLILKPTYAEINDLVKGRRVDVAFVCSLAYVKGRQDSGMELLVAPQMRGEIVYHSYLIVPQGSTATSLQDLRGSTFAFTDPLSNSGHLAPSYQLSLLGESPDTFFRRYSYTYSHDNSIKAVADRLVSAAAVDSLVYDQMRVRDPATVSRTKVIAMWGPYGIPPVVVSPALDPQLKLTLRDLMTGMHASDEGSRILGDLGIDKFVVVNDDIYDSIREMQTKLGW